MRTVLVIEDDSLALKNIVGILKSEGYMVVGAIDGEEGIELTRRHLPDLVMCDIVMPKVNGYEVLRQLRQHSETTTIPFIFMTAMSGWTDLRAGMRLGADDYLVKPFTPEELVGAVAARLARLDEQNQWYLAQMDDLRSSLTRTLPHELRTPLSCILGYSDFLLEICDTVSPSELRAMLTEIRDSGKRLERLIENYHLYAQLEARAADPAERKAMLNVGLSRPEQIVESVAEKCSTGWHRLSDLTLQVAQGSVRMQEDYLRKITEELVDNAFKFSNPATRVWVEGRLAQDGYVLTIADEGRGMEADQLGKLNAFVQLGRAKHEQQGLGLGLAITKRLVELHQGVVAIESTPGRGTTVEVTLRAAT